ncbi:MAG: hypothetical protein ABI904_01340 [Chloroflexota bacterium]
MSARANHRTLKLTHTIADLTGSEKIQPSRLADALQYRRSEVRIIPGDFCLFA